MSARDELAQVIVDAIGDQFHDNGEYIRIDSLTEVCLDGYADLTGVADVILEAGFGPTEDQTLRDRQRAQFARDAVAWRQRAESAEALLEEIRVLVAADALVPSSNTHYELRALLERNPA